MYANRRAVNDIATRLVSGCSSKMLKCLLAACAYEILVPKKTLWPAEKKRREFNFQCQIFYINRRKKKKRGESQRRYLIRHDTRNGMDECVARGDYSSIAESEIFVMFIFSLKAFFFLLLAEAEEKYRKSEFFFLLLLHFTTLLCSGMGRSVACSCFFSFLSALPHPSAQVRISFSGFAFPKFNTKRRRSAFSLLLGIAIATSDESRWWWKFLRRIMA